MNRSNNFDFLRQFAAFLVIVGHSQTLHGDVASGFWDVSVSTFGVEIFFAVSGYLVTESWLRNPSAGAFLLKRGARIFPGLALCVVLTVFVAGPALTTLAVSDYFAAGRTYLYLKNIILNTIYPLPGLFATNTYPDAVNGSLWTLPLEFACYIWVMVAGLLHRYRRVLAGLTAVLVAVVLYDLVPGHKPMIIWEWPFAEARFVMTYFFAGAVLRLLRRWVSFRADLAVVAVAVIVATGIVWPGHIWVVGWVAVPYLVLCFGLGELPVIRRFGRFGDPSYGMYLYAFPIQQTTMYLSGNQISLPLMMAVTTILSVGLGFASWHLVEHRALLWTKGPLKNSQSIS